MENQEQLELLKIQEKARVKNLKARKNRSYFFNFLQIEFYYLLILGLLIQVNSDLDVKIKQYKKPYISLIIIGNGLKQLVGSDSIIVPDKAFITPTFIPLTIYNDYSININRISRENNITLEFSNTDLDMQYLFKDLEHIKKVDLSNYNIKPSNTSYMFSCCYNLKEVIFGNFDTSNVTNMAGMFQGTSVISLDLNKFNTSKVENMNAMFDYCTELKYLDLSSFDFSKVTKADFMLNRIQNTLKYLNIYSYKDDEIFDSFFFKRAGNDVIFCIDEEKAPKLFSDLLEDNYIINCSYISTSEKEEEPALTEIINAFSSNEITEEFTIKNLIQDISSKIILNTENKENINTTTIKKMNSIEDCSGEDIFSKKCKIENVSLSVEDKDNLIYNIMNDIQSGNLNTILDNILNGNEDDYVIKEDDVMFQLTTTENQNLNDYTNISSIKLGNCEEILRNYYKINSSLSLIILKVDYFIEEFNIPVIGYEVFHPLTKVKLNLSLCDNTTVTYNIPVDIKEDELEKYNTSSDYYNDECSVYTTDDGTDIIIADRKQEYNDNNMFLCESNCEYTEYNTTTKKSVCNCEVKSKIYSISEIINNKEEISQSFNISTSSNSGSNLNLMKCVDTLFSKYGLLKNLEFYILIIMAVLYAGSGILFYRMGYPILENDIKEILDNIYENKQQRNKKKTRSRKIKSTINKNNNNISNPKKRKKNANNTSRNKEQNVNIAKSTVNLENSNNYNNNNKTVTKLKVINHENNDINIHDNNDNINITNIPDINNLTIYELNNLSYQEALLIDKRDFSQYYFSLIRTKHPLLFSFVPLNDYNNLIIKMNLFILNFAICSAINALFFTKSTIHKIYKDKGKYDFGFFIGKIIISFLISHIIFVVIKYFILSERNIVNIKQKSTYDEAYDEADKAKRCLIIKYILFYAVGVAFLIVFWYYLSSFCAVYQNTQIFLIINTFITIVISFIYPFIINFIPAFLRKIALDSKNQECLYKANGIIQMI